MSKQQQHGNPAPQRDYDTQRLVVWGERRKEPDWDTYIAALLAYALAQVEGEDGQGDD